MVALRQRLTLRAEHVKREENVDADALSNAAMDLVQRQRPTREQQEADLAAFRASELGKAMSLGGAYKKVTGRPWFYGHECATTILTSVGGTVVRGASRRAQLTETTDAVILGIREHIRTLRPTQTETTLYSQHLEWAATYIPEEAYPAGWAQGKADWKARAERKNKVPGAGACRGSQPKKAPEDAVNTSRPITPRRDLHATQEAPMQGMREKALTSGDVLPAETTPPWRRRPKAADAILLDPQCRDHLSEEFPVASLQTRTAKAGVGRSVGGAVRAAAPSLRVTASVLTQPGPIWLAGEPVSRGSTVLTRRELSSSWQLHGLRRRLAP
ncbi:hypothetical protein DIPPA_30396 [Diplonema papillatum]|nr:hypothetical protein DIPPA_30396 [Diplonema papillatum]